MRRLLFYLLYPLVWLYSPLFTRARILIVAEGHFVAVKHHFGNGNWHLPGGGKKRGESLLQVAVREAKEELGLSIDPSTVSVLLPLKPYFNLGLIQRAEVFLVKLPKKLPLKPNREIKTAAWLPTNLPKTGLGHITKRALNRLD